MTGTYCHRTRKSIQAGSGRSDADTSCDLQQFFLLARFYHSSMHGAHLACQASAPWRSPQKRKSKSQEFEDADVFCSWIGVGYMHTSQNTTALAFATPSSQNVIWGKWIEWSPWPNLAAIHTSVIRAPCLTRTKRPPCHAWNCHMRSLYHSQPGTGCITAILRIDEEQESPRNCRSDGWYEEWIS